jgi:hypothetical protein
VSNVLGAGRELNRGYIRGLPVHSSAEHLPSSGGECVGKGSSSKTTVGVTDCRREFFPIVSVSALGRN